MAKKAYTCTEIRSVANLVNLNPEIPTTELQDLCFESGILHGSAELKGANWQNLKRACQHVLGTESLLFTGGSRYSKVKLTITMEEVDQKIASFGGINKEISIPNPWREKKKLLEKEISTTSTPTVKETVEEKKQSAQESYEIIRNLNEFLDNPDKGNITKTQLRDLCLKLDGLQRRGLKNLVVERWIEAKKKEVDELREEFL